MDAPSAAPVRKVIGATLGAAVATIVIWALGQAGIELNDSVSAAIVTVVVFIVGYLVPAAPEEQGAQYPAQQQPGAVQNAAQWPGVQEPSSGTVGTPRPVQTKRSPAPEEKLISQPKPTPQPESPPVVNPHPSDQPPSAPPPGVFPPENDTPAG